MKFAQRNWGWRYFSKYVTKNDWAKECSGWITDEICRGLSRTVGFEVGRYISTVKLSDWLDDLNCEEGK